MIAHTVTVTVPPALYDELRQRAEQGQRSIEDEVVLALAAALPGEPALPDMAATLSTLAALDDDTL